MAETQEEVVPEKSEAVPCALLSSTEAATNVYRDENCALCVEVESVEQPVESIPVDASEVSQEEVDTSEIASLMQKAVAADGSTAVNIHQESTSVELAPQPSIEPEPVPWKPFVLSSTEPVNVTEPTWCQSV